MSTYLACLVRRSLTDFLHLAAGEYGEQWLYLLVRSRSHSPLRSQLRSVFHDTGSYASWFTTQPTIPPGSTVPSLLLNALKYVVSALTEPNLCLFAATALRDLCDANRTALAPHIAAFGELHAQVVNIPVRLIPQLAL